MRIAYMLAAFFCMASALHGAEVDAETCKIYRQGPLVSKRVAVYQKPEVYDWLDIHYRYEYVWQPDLPHDAFGASGPNRDALFEIEIETGQPIEQRPGQSPFDYTHFTLLIDGRAYLRDLGRLIGIYSMIPSPDMPGRWENGVLVEQVVPFQRTDDWFYGYERIVVTAATQKDTELFIQESTDGKITSLMRCDRLGSVPNPGCTIHESSTHFTMEFSFNRSQAHLIEKIREHAHTFTECLTLQNEEK